MPDFQWYLVNLLLINNVEGRGDDIVNKFKENNEDDPI